MKTKSNINSQSFGQSISIHELLNLDIAEYRRRNLRLTPREKLDEYLTRVGLIPSAFESAESARRALEEASPNHSILLSLYKEKLPTLLANDAKRYPQN